MKILKYKIAMILEYILSLPKSVLFCIRCLPLRRALHLPILVRYNVLVKHVGQIELGGGRFRSSKNRFRECGNF